MDIDQLKRKLRELKKAEERIRFDKGFNSSSRSYVWEDYFCTKSFNNLVVKYPLWKLIKYDKQQLREAFEDYFYCIYFRKYKENGLNFEDIYDPELLSIFGLHPGASVDDIKKRFRELAKKYHPDHGGESEKMIDLLDAYHKLLDRE